MTVLALDAPGTRCAFESHGCSRLVEGCGGFDQHHAIPVELGGDPKQPLLPLCPVHHRRIHAAIRALVENSGVWPAGVSRRYTTAERANVEAAYAAWVSNGSPKINGWPCPAARPLLRATPASRTGGSEGARG